MSYQAKESVVIDIGPHLSPVDLVIEASRQFDSQVSADDVKDYESNPEEGEQAFVESPSSSDIDLPIPDKSNPQGEKKRGCESFVSYEHCIHG
jgi:hypothetical protein